MRALTNALANDRHSTEALRPMPYEWMQLIRLFGSVEKRRPAMTTDEQYDHDTSAVLLRLRGYIETWFGPRCPEYESGCAVCYMWNVYDKLSKHTQ